MEGVKQVLDEEIKYFDEHLNEWIARYPGKFVLVKGTNLVGTFDRYEEALTEGARQFKLDSFLVRRVEPTVKEINIPALTLGLLSAIPSHTIRRPGPNA